MEDVKKKIVRGILTAYFNTIGFLFYVVYLWHPWFNKRVFYSPTMHKYYLHVKKNMFMSNYADNSMIGVYSFVSRPVKFTYKDLGLYKLKIQKKNYGE